MPLKVPSGSSVTPGGRVPAVTATTRSPVVSSGSTTASGAGVPPTCTVCASLASASVNDGGWFTGGAVTTIVTVAVSVAPCGSVTVTGTA